MATTDIFHISGSLVPSRKALRFLGGNVDDYVQVDAAAVALVAADTAQGTISAWVNVPDITGTYCIICAGDDNAVEFIEMNVEAGKIAVRATDATTAQFVSITDSVHIKPHQWIHVACVQAADGAGAKIYVNGVRVAHTNSTATDVDSWFVETDGIDTMRIGAANKAGDASVTNEFKGAISDVKIWSVALTAAQILADYQGVVNTTNLENHWDFDDDLIDVGAGLDPGTIVGAIVFCPNYSEFSSRLGFMNSLVAPVVADAVTLSCTDKTGHAVIIKAA